MAAFSAPQKQYVGQRGGHTMGSDIADYTSGATAVGLGITAATGGMDFGLATAIGAGVEFLGSIFGSYFDEPPKPVYQEIQDNSPMLQLPTPGTQLFVPQGINVMPGPSLSQQYGVQNPLGFFE